MQKQSIHAVTGAFGYSGKYIAQNLLAAGQSVITLTNSVGRENEFAQKIKAISFQFDNPAKLAKALENVEVLYNTYWVRFNHKLFTHADAVRNTVALFHAAKSAGVQRIVHISITNPSEDSPLEYFSGKGKLERILKESGLSYAIIRPTVLFGQEDILINNIAWALRHLPIFGVFGDGQYKIQPIYVKDLAQLCVEYGETRDNAEINAIGPETFTYRELVAQIGELIGVKRPIVSAPPFVGLMAGKIIGSLTGDVFITKEEIKGLMANLLCVDTPPTGKTRLTDWIREHSKTLGLKYTSELARRKNRESKYDSN